METGTGEPATITGVSGELVVIVGAFHSSFCSPGIYSQELLACQDPHANK